MFLDIKKSLQNSLKHLLNFFNDLFTYKIVVIEENTTHISVESQNSQEDFNAQYTAATLQSSKRSIIRYSANSIIFLTTRASLKSLSDNVQSLRRRLIIDLLVNETASSSTLLLMICLQALLSSI